LLTEVYRRAELEGKSVTFWVEEAIAGALKAEKAIEQK
jgi:hypothetical protein